MRRSIGNVLLSLMVAGFIATAAPAGAVPVTGVDTEPPLLSNIALSASRVPAAGGEVTVSMHITDTSGVDTGPTVSFGTFYDDVLPRRVLHRTSGTAQDGIWSVEYPFASPAHLGSYIARFSGFADTAGNTASAGTVSSARVAFGIALPPSAPTVAQRADRVLQVSWAPPADDGGSAVTGFVVRWSSDQLGTGTVTSTDASRTWLDFPADRFSSRDPLRFTVSAVNEGGESDPSRSSEPVRVAATAPDPAQPVVATPQDHALRVSWGYPSSDHGASIGRFVARAEPGAHTCASTPESRLSCTIDGLVSGVGYNVTVLADNGSGTSTSASITASPTGRLAPVAATRAVGAVGAVRVDWTVAADGSAATAFEVTLVPDGTSGLAPVTLQAPASARSLSATGVQPGVGYVATVIAMRQDERSDVAEWPFRVVPTLAPAVPRAVGAVAVFRRTPTVVTFGWFPPRTEPGSTVDLYEIRVLRGTSTVRTVHQQPEGVPFVQAAAGGLVPATRYAAQVRAHTSAGWGPFSPTRTFMTAGSR